MEKERKKLYIALTILLGLLIIGLTSGLILYYFNNISEFVVIFAISYPFMLITYFSLRYVYLHFENSSKGKISFLIGYILRFVSIIGALLFSLLYLHLTSGLNAPQIYYIFIAPILFTIGYIVGILFK